MGRQTMSISKMCLAIAGMVVATLGAQGSGQGTQSAQSVQDTQGPALALWTRGQRIPRNTDICFDARGAGPQTRPTNGSSCQVGVNEQPVTVDHTTSYHRATPNRRRLGSPSRIQLPKWSSNQ